MSLVKYLLDEDIAKWLGTAIERANPSITVTHVDQDGAPEGSAPDREILVWSEANGFTIVSKDRKTMPRHAADHILTGNHTWGVFILRTGFTVREIVEYLMVVHGASQAEEWQDRVIFVPEE